MSEKKRARSAIGVGITTLVTIMVAVLLTTFSVLTLVTARADLRLSQKTVESTASYYLADGLAEQWLADLDALLQQNNNPSADDLLAGGFLVGETEDGRLAVWQEFAIDENRELRVEVALNSDGSMALYRWQSVSRQ